MDRKPLLLILVAGVAMAQGQRFAPSPDLCFASGTVTYRLSTTARASDYRVAVNNDAARPDLRVRLVDRVEAADFALTDDAGARIGSGCQAGGSVRTVRVVPPGAPSDITIAISSEPTVAADVSLYVYSARVSHFDAAALFALVRRTSDDSNQALGGSPERLARIR
jgi:hypothetical protein